MEAEASRYAVDHLSWAGLSLFSIVGLFLLFGLAMILSTFTGRSHRVRNSEQAPDVHRHRGPAIMAPLVCVVFVAIAVVLVLTLNVSEQRVANVDASSSTHPIAQTGPPRTLVSSSSTAVSAEVPPHTRSESIHTADDFRSNDPFGSPSDSSPDETPENKGTEPDAPPLPKWTHRKQTVLAEGQVPKILFVETSGLYSSEEEALAEAMTKAISKFHTRLIETYRELAEQPVPENIFREASLQQVYTEKRIHTFGVYDEPMYRVYLQYVDSAEAREPIVDAWKSTFASNRAMRLAIIFGILTAILGVVSAGLRAISAARGDRSRSVMTALVLAGAAAFLFMK